MRSGRRRASRQGPADQFRSVIRRGRELVEPLDRASFNRRPGPERWSAGQCIDHLNATARVYLPVLTEAIEGARAQGLVDGRRDGRTLLGRLLAWSQEPPARFRTRTADVLEPDREPELDPDAVMEEFENLHEELIVRINESGDLDRKRVKIRSVIVSRLRLSLGDWFAFLAAHARRHLWQAEQVLAQARPPARPG